MKNEISPALLRKYLNGTCTPEETAMLHQWYHSFEDQEDPLSTLSSGEQEVLKKAMISRFKASLISEGAVSEPDLPKRPFMDRWLYAAAGIAALLLLAWSLSLFNRGHLNNINSTIATTITDKMLINNMANSIYKQTLPDGSVVWLSPKSQLEFPKKFTGATREVTMRGEAFFEVSKDHQHPFIIYGGGVITRVWGTSFRIRALQNKPTEVSVLTGKVSVKIAERDDSEVMLYPRDEVTYVKSSQELKKVTESRSSLKIWQKATLSFDNVRLGEVINKLDNKFNVHIYTDDEELADYELKADFTDQNLPAILDMLEGSLNISYTITDKEIVLFKKQPISNK